MAWKKIDEAGERNSSPRWRNLHFVVVGLFAALLIMHPYHWSQGSDSIYRSLAPAGMLSFGLGNLLTSRGPLYYLLFAIGLLMMLVACVVATLMPSEMFG